MTEQAEPKPQAVATEARKALRCLYITVEESIARDVAAKVEAAFVEIEAQARREGAREALQALVEMSGAEFEEDFIIKLQDVSPADAAELGYSMAIMRLEKAIRALAAEPEVKERKTIVHQGPLQEDGTWHSEPEVKPCSCECHERTPKACESCRERHESAPSKAEELPLPLGHEFQQCPGQPCGLPDDHCHFYLPTGYAQRPADDYCGQLEADHRRK